MRFLWVGTLLYSALTLNRQVQCPGMKITNTHQFNRLFHALEHDQAYQKTHPQLPVSPSAFSAVLHNAEEPHVSALTRWIISEVFCYHFEHLGIFCMNRLYMSPQRMFTSICFLFITLCFIQCFKHCSCSSSLRSILKSQVWLRCFPDVFSIQKWLMPCRFWWHPTLCVALFFISCGFVSEL